MEEVIYFRNQVIKFLYKNLLKPILFLRDPEFIHDMMTDRGKLLGSHDVTRFVIRKMFYYENPMLAQTILGINFKNPIGLAAGFDKNAQLTEILPEVGFGFEEAGSFTGEPCLGNSGKRLWRLPKSKSLVVYYGLKNDGAEVLSKKLASKKFNFVVGTSIAKTNNQQTCETDLGIKDYVKGFKAFTKIGDYFTINISCPNTYGGQPFTDYQRLEKLLVEIDKIPTKKPIFLKVSPDLSKKEIDQILAVVDKHRVNGFICTNLTKNRKNTKIKETVVPENGGLSGKVVEDLSNELIAYLYQKTKGKYVIVGCGGVFTAEDAYKKIKLGASLVQLITGMIYEGPQVISEINQGLVKLLKADGYSNISQAVGKGID